MKQVLQKSSVRFWLFLFLLFPLSGSLVWAQNPVIVSGVVRDARTGVTLPGVVVKLSGTNAATSTTVNGSYKLNVNVPAGTHQFTFSFIGYKAVTKSVQLSSSAVTVDAVLAEDALNLDEV
ncbi:carboxypeptidase-like regulatory domain-containing protein, partial [Arcticibacter svalbardensis]|uniref:carboxypeptidase-like regulatory domain-containing protein n=1 Tax=Arcticibacter svalbardensis TaxID=1288027 RepID=UPI00058DF38F